MHSSLREPRVRVCVSKGMQLLKWSTDWNIAHVLLSPSLPFFGLWNLLSATRIDGIELSLTEISILLFPLQNTSHSRCQQVYTIQKKWPILMNYPNQLFLLILLAILWRALDFKNNLFLTILFPNNNHQLSMCILQFFFHFIASISFAQFFSPI